MAKEIVSLVHFVPAATFPIGVHFKFESHNEKVVREVHLRCADPASFEFEVGDDVLEVVGVEAGASTLEEEVESSEGTVSLLGVAATSADVALTVGVAEGASTTGEAASFFLGAVLGDLIFLVGFTRVVAVERTTAVDEGVSATTGVGRGTTGAGGATDPAGSRGVAEVEEPPLEVKVIILF